MPPAAPLVHTGQSSPLKPDCICLSEPADRAAIESGYLCPDRIRCTVRVGLHLPSSFLARDPVRNPSLQLSHRTPFSPNTPSFGSTPVHASLNRLGSRRLLTRSEPNQPDTVQLIFSYLFHGLPMFWFEWNLVPHHFLTFITHGWCMSYHLKTKRSRTRASKSMDTFQCESTYLYFCIKASQLVDCVTNLV